MVELPPLAPDETSFVAVWRRAVPWLQAKPIWRAADASSAIDLPEHDVERAENGGHVSELVALAEEVHRLQVGIARSADLATIGLVGAIGTT